VIGAGCAASPADGKALIEYAASAGSELALRHLSVLVLSGADGPLDTNRGIALAARAAAAGDVRAASELEALLGQDADWASLDAVEAAQARAAALLNAPAGSTLSQAPRISRFPSVASATLRDWLRQWSEPALAPAATIDRASGQVRIENARTNRFARIGLFDQPLELQLLKLRLARIVGQPVTHFEGTNVLAYEPGERFEVHHDYLDPAEPGFADELARHGQRVGTVLIAINADYSGGETVFPALGLSWRGQPGEALYFRNVDDRGEPDSRTLHAGQPPASGRKWLLSQWVRDRPQPPG
jgi:prolyl 4-hydroxylase